MKRIKILTLILFVIYCVGCKKDNENSGENKINGHEYVDLGLLSGLKWATCNIGAALPSDYGNYYAWGETLSKSEYTNENCITYKKDMGDISGNSQYDAAVVNWGTPWRMPKNSEFQELMDKCSWSWTTQNGHDGYKVVGPNGKFIFLPAAGFRGDLSLYHAGEDGYYWSSTSDEIDSYVAYGLGFYGGDHYSDWYLRYYGRFIRPVTE